MSNKPTNIKLVKLKYKASKSAPIITDRLLNCLKYARANKVDGVFIAFSRNGKHISKRDCIAYAAKNIDGIENLCAHIEVGYELLQSDLDKLYEK